MRNKENIKTPEQVFEEMRKRFEEIKIKWKKHLDKEEKSYILTLHEKTDPQKDDSQTEGKVTKWIREVWGWIDKALKDTEEENEIVVWQELYKKWNGTDDLSRDKYNHEKDLYGGLVDLRLFLLEWERVKLIQKLLEALQKLGINSDDENMPEKIEELKKIQDDLTDLGVDKSKVKETIENERAELTQIKYQLENYFGEKYEAKIEIK